MCFFCSRAIRKLEARMSAEFDGLKSVIGEAIVVLKSLSDKVGTTVQDPPAADIVAATQQLRIAVDAANAVLNPPV